MTRCVSSRIEERGEVKGEGDEKEKTTMQSGTSTLLKKTHG
jgi:hypothetical protein